MVTQRNNGETGSVMPGHFNCPRVCGFLLYISCASGFLCQKETTLLECSMRRGYVFVMHASVTEYVLHLCVSLGTKEQIHVWLIPAAVLRTACPIPDMILLLFHEVISAIQLAAETCCKGHSVSVVVTEPSHKRGQKCSIRGSVG